MGLVSNSLQPAASAFSREPASAWAESAMMGMSRVAGSLVHSAGIDELIARDVADYKAKAIVYARSRELRSKVIGKLELARRDAALFDMKRFAGAFERAVLGMAERARYSQSPTDFDVEDAL